MGVGRSVQLQSFLGGNLLRGSLTLFSIRGEKIRSRMPLGNMMLLLSSLQIKTSVVNRATPGARSPGVPSRSCRFTPPQHTEVWNVRQSRSGGGTSFCTMQQRNKGLNMPEGALIRSLGKIIFKQRHRSGAPPLLAYVRMCRVVCVLSPNRYFCLLPSWPIL